MSSAMHPVSNMLNQYTAVQLCRLLQGQRFPLSKEKETQRAIEDLLCEKECFFSREVELDERSIIDFMVGGIGIEIKTKGNRRKIFEQLERYAAFDRIEELILVTSVSMGLPSTINNKPVYYVNLSKAWL